MIWPTDWGVGDERMAGDKADYRRLIGPILGILKHTDTFVYVDEINEALVEHLGMTVADLEQMLPSGRQTVFENQLQWALSYLEQDFFIESDGANAFRITTNGRRLSEGDEVDRDKIIPAISHEQLPVSEFAGPYGMAEDGDRDPVERQHKQPAQVMALEFEQHYQALKSEIIQRIHGESPAFFENLIIDLLVSMGYGDRRRDLVEHLGKSGDGGIDGAVRQDQLGLDVVYIQAKRYRPDLAVPVAAVRDFAGALESHKANKGLFVTTSHFTRSGRKFITAVSSRIVLIDGARLASLLIRNNVGVKIRETYEIKGIDEDYFK